MHRATSEKPWHNVQDDGDGRSTTEPTSGDHRSRRTQSKKGIGGQEQLQQDSSRESARLCLLGGSLLGGGLRHLGLDGSKGFASRSVSLECSSEPSQTKGGLVRSASVCKPHESERGGNASQSCDTDRVARCVRRSAGSAMQSLEPAAATTRYTASSQLASVPSPRSLPGARESGTATTMSEQPQRLLERCGDTYLLGSRLLGLGGR